MKIVKEVSKINLPINIKLSKRLKGKYGHMPKLCYDNAFTLLLRGEIDTYVIGWVVSEGVPFPIRHGFGIAGGRIVDSTLNSDTLLTCSYYTMLELTREDMLKLFDEFETKGEELHTSLDGYIGYNAENRLQVEIAKEVGILS